MGYPHFFALFLLDTPSTNRTLKIQHSSWNRLREDPPVANCCWGLVRRVRNPPVSSISLAKFQS